jgi:hypothetical protein
MKMFFRFVFFKIALRGPCKWVREMAIPSYPVSRGIMGHPVSGGINPKTWSSRFGVGRGVDKPTPEEN